jgi:hypothetical protein
MQIYQIETRLNSIPLFGTKARRILAIRPPSLARRHKNVRNLEFLTASRKELISLRQRLQAMSTTSRKSIWRQRGFDSPGTHPLLLLDLPMELYLQIVEQLDYISMICLKLSCKRLYETIPMPPLPRPSNAERRLALLKRIPPPVRPEFSPYMLCCHCQKYHSSDWFVRPVAGHYHILRVWENEHYWILTNATATICARRKLEDDKGKRTPITKLCRECGAFAPQRGFVMYCACGRCSYVLLYCPKDDTKWYHCGNFKWVLVSSLPRNVRLRCDQFFY